MFTPFGDYCAKRIPNAEFLSLRGRKIVKGEHRPLLAWFFPPNDADRALVGPNRPSFDGIEDSIAFIHCKVNNLIDHGTTAENIHLLGHSQGGAMAISSGLTFDKKLGSVCTIAGYLALTPEMQPFAKGIKYYLHHSIQDDNVNIRWAQYARNYLCSIGEPCELACWSMDRDPHQIHPCQLDAICSVITDA